MASHAKEVLRSIYTIDDPTLAEQFVTRLSVDLQDADCPTETQQLGRTIARWAHQIVAWHSARVSNGPTEAMNRTGFGGGSVYWFPTSAWSPCWAL